MTILSTACERAGPEGRDVRSLRVSSTHAFEESLSRRSEISRGDWVGTTGFLGSEASLGFLDEFDLVIGACLGPTLTLGADFAILPFFTVVVTVFSAGFSVTGQGAGGAAALTPRPPRTTWSQPEPSFSCSADGSARVT